MAPIDAHTHSSEHRAALSRYRAALPLLLLASACSGEAGNSPPAVAPIAPPAAVTISASSTSPPAATPPPAPTAAPVPPDGYEPSVRAGNTAPLDAARVPFAGYLNAIHNRIHPIFADEFLAVLTKVPASHPLNQDLRATVELVVEQKTGRLVKTGITRSSGVTDFDRVVLRTVKRAQPFAAAPESIASPDGNVYVHWEFHRDPVDACSTRNAQPFLLKSTP